MKALIFIVSLIASFGIHGVFGGKGWYMGGLEESCDTACEHKGLVCTKEGYKYHHSDVGSSAALLDMIQKLGGTTSDKECELAHFSGLPVFKSNICAYSDNPDIFDCSKQPHPRGENRKRICFCEPAKDSGNNEVVEVLYREVGRTEKPDYSTDCSLIPSTATYIKLVMGEVVDYYRPIAGKTFCEMLQSNKLHQWSPDGLNWVTPAYTSLPHLGGSAIDWPSDGRKYLSFWGSNIQKGGCCISEYDKYDGRSWMLEFKLYYVSGHKLPVIIECAGKQCGDACSEGICDGNGGCVSPDYNPCAVHGCDGKKCGEGCLAGDIIGICTKEGECNIATQSIYNRFPVICDELEEGEACGCDMTEKCLGECKPGLECIIEGLGHGTCTKKEKPEPPTKPTTCDYGQYCALADCSKTGAADLCPDQCSPKPPVLIECAGKQCGDACSEGICDGNGGCVSPDYNPCTVHGCDGKKCGERCSAGDVMGICNKDGDCKIDTDFEFCDGPSETCNDGEKNQGETGRDCGGPCPDCEYYEGKAGKVCNNEDDVIRTKEECKEALSELAKQMNVHKHTYWEGNKKNIPAGCSIRLQNNRLHFNTQPGFGKGRKGQTPICRGKVN